MPQAGFALITHLRLSEPVIGLSAFPLLYHHAIAQNQAGSHSESLYASVKTVSTGNQSVVQSKELCVFALSIGRPFGGLEFGFIGGNPNPSSRCQLFPILVCGLVSMLAAWWPQEGHCAPSSTAS